MTPLEILMAGAGVVAASSCCAAPSLWRARFAAILMALACLPIADGRWALGVGVALFVASILLAAGARSRPSSARSMDLHRALGGALMGGMVLLGEHTADVSSGAHAHGVPAHAILAVASVVYLAWTCALLADRVRRHRVAERTELIAMAVMFGAMILGMGSALV
ncbi:hypothetical protein [Microbacterium suaedae]|uniref:hypothetical protein n=1 Tax=Microbacterium suaedae TaxID=2067813 RepID=UPI000DA1E9FD|nr:hypothetical protein [Microbacterium suaedae]